MSATPRETATWPRAVAVLLILVGAVLRLRQYLAARSLWLDEASLALNILPRSFVQLTEQLDFEQVAPVPFLWAVKASTIVFGSGELALRLVPFVAGVAALVVMRPLGTAALGDRLGLLPLAVTALSPSLIYYSNELKPYSTDVLAASWLLWLALRVDGWRLAAGGALAILMSFPAVLIAVPAGGVVVFNAARSGDHRRIRSAAAGVGCWGAAFLLGYGWARAHGGSSAYLRLFWESSFLSLRDPVAAWRLLAAAIQQAAVGAPASSGVVDLQVVVVLALATAGAVWLWRQHRPELLALTTLPALAALLASALGLYPISARTLLFLLPVLILLCAAGAVGWARPVAVRALGILLLIVPALAVDVPRFRQPRRREDLNPIVSKIRGHSERGDLAYIYARAIPAWTYYTTDWLHPDSARLDFIRRIAGSSGLAFENAPSRGHAVEREGDDLIWRGTDGLMELFGVSTGVGPSGRRSPDSGWATNEVRRLRAAGPTAWLVFSHVVDGADRELVAAGQTAGGTVTETLEAEGARAFKIRWPD